MFEIHYLNPTCVDKKKVRRNDFSMRLFPLPSLLDYGFEDLRQRTNRDSIGEIKQVSQPRILVRNLSLFSGNHKHTNESCLSGQYGVFGLSKALSLSPSLPTWFVRYDRRSDRESAIRVRLGQAKIVLTIYCLEASMCR